MKLALFFTIFLGVIQALALPKMEWVAGYESATQFEPTFRKLKITLFNEDLGQRLDIQGHFHLNDKEGIRSVVEKLDPTQKILLIRMMDFQGGYDGPGDLFQAAIRKHAKDNKVTVITYLPPSQTCASMCVEIFMLGHYRLVTPTGVFGIHAGRITQPDGSFRSDPKFAYNNLNRAGVSRKWLKEHKHYFKNFEEMHYFSAEELEGSGLSTHLIEDSFEINRILPGILGLRTAD